MNAVLLNSYDPTNRSEIAADLGKAALRSLFELKNATNTGSDDPYFGPNAPAGQENRSIKTIPGKGWFPYFRIYGPGKPTFGRRKPGEFE
jgi:hypothetical protein